MVRLHGLRSVRLQGYRVVRRKGRKDTMKPKKLYPGLKIMVFDTETEKYNRIVHARDLCDLAL